MNNIYINLSVKIQKKIMQMKIDSKKKSKIIMNEMQTRVVNSQIAYEFIESMR